jgi:hypothetical protein
LDTLSDMSSPFSSVQDVINALGKVGKAAETLGVGQTTVLNWIYRNRLPADRYFMIRDLLAPLTVPDELWAMGRKTDRRRQQVPDSALPRTVSPAGA